MRIVTVIYLLSQITTLMLCNFGLIPISLVMSFIPTFVMAVILVAWTIWVVVNGLTEILFDDWDECLSIYPIEDSYDEDKDKETVNA